MTNAMDTPASLPKIRAIKVLSRHRIQITWDDNKISHADMGDLIAEGNAFAPLKDQDLFATARIGERRRTIEWPDPTDASALLTDYCADALRERSERQGTIQDFQKFLRMLKNRLAHSTT